MAHQGGWQRAFAVLAIGLFFAGCLGEGSRDREIIDPEDGMESDAEREVGATTPLLQENESAPPIDPTPTQHLDKENRFLLDGKGPAQVVIESSEPFAIHRVAYYNLERVSIDRYEWWILLAPEGPPVHAAECTADPSGILLWHNTMENRNVFWELPAGRHLFAYDTPVGTWLEVDMTQNYPSSTRDREPYRPPSTPSSFDAFVLPSHQTEKVSGAPVEDSLTAPIIAGQASILFTNFRGSGYSLGELSVESTVVDEAGTVCRLAGAVTAPVAFGIRDVRLTVAVPAEMALKLQVIYVAEIGVELRGSLHAVQVRLPP